MGCSFILTHSKIFCKQLERSLIMTRIKLKQNTNYDTDENGFYCFVNLSFLKFYLQIAST